MNRVTVDDCTIEDGLYGGWRVSAIVNRTRVSRFYDWCSKRQAGVQFCAEMNGDDE